MSSISASVTSSRRRFWLQGLLAATFLFGCPTSAEAKVFYRREEALELAFPGADRVEAGRREPLSFSLATEDDRIIDVNLGHVFALRPRVSTTFKQSDFLTARHLLQDEAWSTIQDAARAVAEKALSLTNEARSKRGFKPGR